MSKNNKLRILIIAYAITIVLFMGIWFAMSAMGYYPPSGSWELREKIEAQGGILDLIGKISALFYMILYWALFIAALPLLVIGAICIHKRYGKYMCLTGIWIFIIYLFSFTVSLTISEFRLPVKFWYWEWLLWDVIPQLLISWVSTIWIFIKIKKLEKIS